MLSGLLVMKEYIGVVPSLLYALIGLIFVFIGIGILIAIVDLVGLVMKKTGGKMPSFKKKKEQTEEKVSAPAPVTAATTEEVSDEVKAAIVAAIMAYYDAEKPQCEFIVKKIKRI